MRFSGACAFSELRLIDSMTLEAAEDDRRTDEQREAARKLFKGRTWERAEMERLAFSQAISTGND